MPGHQCHDSSATTPAPKDCAYKDIGLKSKLFDYVEQGVIGLIEYYHKVFYEQFSKRSY